MPARLTVVGDNETRQHLENIARKLHGDEMVNTMFKATNMVMRDAKKFAPVDTGRLRGSITPSVRSVGLLGRRVQGVVGSNVEYAPFMEEGTRHRRMPPISALEGWARRHGTSAYVVAQAILRNGGLEGHFYMKRGLEQNADAIRKLFEGHVDLAIRSGI